MSEHDWEGPVRGIRECKRCGQRRTDITWQERKGKPWIIWRPAPEKCEPLAHPPPGE